jgi:HlyD family secretion protein
MRRMIIGLVALVVVLAGLVALRLRAQGAIQHAASGGSGEIEGTDVDLSARVAAQVARIHVKKGDAVSKDALLLELDCSDPQAALAEAEARLAAARAQSVAALASVDASRRSQEAAVASREAAKAQALSLAAQRDAAERQAKRLEQLSQDVSFQTRDQSRASADGLAHQALAAEAQARASAEQASAAAVAIKASGAQAAAAQAQAAAAEASVARARLLAGECQIRAPRDAMVNDLPHEVGELVPVGQALVRLVDVSQAKATFYLPNAELAAAKPGARAIVVADAYPDQKFEGRISNVAVKAEFTPRNIQTRSDRDRLVYPVEVLVPNPDLKLRPGMPVQVTLPGTER